MKHVDGGGLEQTLLGNKYIPTAIIFLIICVVALAIANWCFVVVWPNSLPLVRFQVALDGEGNLATTFNAFVLLLVAAVAAMIAWMANRHYNGWATNRLDTWGWLAVAGIFFYLYVDDSAQLHDIFAMWLPGQLFDSLLQPIPRAMRNYVWIPIFVILGIVAVTFMIVFFRRNIWLVPQSALLVVLGFLLFMTNPVLEIAENQRVDLLPSGSKDSQELYTYNYTAWVELQQLIVIEEVSEMLGAISFLGAFLVFGRTILHLGGAVKAVRLPQLSTAAASVPDMTGASTAAISRTT